jgi:hypothetical protein
MKIKVYKYQPESKNCEQAVAIWHGVEICSLKGNLWFRKFSSRKGVTTGLFKAGIKALNKAGLVYALAMIPCEAPAGGGRWAQTEDLIKYADDVHILHILHDDDGLEFVGEFDVDIF